MSLVLEYTPHFLSLKGFTPNEASLRQVSIFSFPFFGNATASIVGDDTSHFKVVRLTSYEVDAPNGQPEGMTIIGDSDGTEPVDITRNGSLDVRVLVTAPATSGTRLSAQLVVSGRSTPHGRIWEVQVP